MGYADVHEFHNDDRGLVPHDMSHDALLCVGKPAQFLDERSDHAYELLFHHTNQRIYDRIHNVERVSRAHAAHEHDEHGHRSARSQLLRYIFVQHTEDVRELTRTNHQNAIPSALANELPSCACDPYGHLRALSARIRDPPPCTCDPYENPRPLDSNECHSSDGLAQPLLSQLTRGAVIHGQRSVARQHVHGHKLDVHDQMYDARAR